VLHELRSIRVANSLLCGSAQGFAELLIEIEWDDWLRQVIQVSPQDICRVVDRESVPHEALAIAIGGVKDGLELLDALFGSAQSENTLDARS
jgi:hypothetical protein